MREPYIYYIPKIAYIYCTYDIHMHKNTWDGKEECMKKHLNTFTFFPNSKEKPETFSSILKIIGIDQP